MAASREPVWLPGAHQADNAALAVAMIAEYYPTYAGNIFAVNASGAHANVQHPPGAAPAPYLVMRGGGSSRGQEPTVEWHAATVFPEGFRRRRYQLVAMEE